MENNHLTWIIYERSEFGDISHTHSSIPRTFKKEGRLDKLKKELNGYFAPLKEGMGREVWIDQAPFLIIKKDSKEFIGIGQPRPHSAASTMHSEVSVPESFVFQSKKMKEVMDLVRKVSFVDSTVLLLGKTGVGKSHIARRLHQYSQRASKTFAVINCSTIPEALMEAELFGYTPGSFTGGKKEGKPGIFQSAMGGTVFLDEIGEIPFHLQAKLLEVLQENHIRPIGAVHSVPVDVRVIAATNQNLEEMVARKLFREDLYYRLNVVPIQIPSLSERKDELAVLIDHFLTMYNEKYNTDKLLAPDVLGTFEQYAWPGNVRELEHMIERLLITTEADIIVKEHLPDYLFAGNKGPEKSAPLTFTPLKEAKDNVERELIVEAYRLYKTTYKVAEILQVNQSTIAKKVKKYREDGVL